MKREREEQTKASSWRKREREEQIPNKQVKENAGKDYEKRTKKYIQPK